jgi:guanosine-3',5'-bis(diphosphate) 3'-pyrophosphohydrolase
METVKENRERFFARLVHLSRADLMRVQLAYTLAKFSHRAQVRKELDDEGRPLRYFEHPRRVALVLMDELKITDPILIIAALLHDGIEDTRDLTPEMIEFHFGHEVARIVALLSKVPKEGYHERLLNYGDWAVYLIKACDRLDNLRSLEGSSPEFRAKQVKETRQLYYPLFNKMTEIAPPVFCQVSRDLRDRIAVVVESL